MSVEERIRYEIREARKEAAIEGREEGRERNKVEIATSMLKDNLPDDFIIKHTKLSKEQLIHLKKVLVDK